MAKAKKRPIRRPPTTTEAHLWTCLRAFHQGHRAGISPAILARQVGLSDHRLRETLTDLVRVHGKPICTHPDHGVFVIRDNQDAALAQRCRADASALGR
ncbi:MAG: hypothetical protein IT369_16525 [Candidatus Latescibacteria bacterium]|nr:hypothetical protein [Candidatus Latescibacterota bacterium]